MTAQTTAGTAPGTSPAATTPGTSRRAAGWAVTVVIVLLAFGFGGYGRVADVETGSIVLMYAAMAGGWNLLGGYAGYLNFGTVMFFGVGAYATAMANTGWHLNPVAAIPLAAIAAAAVAAILGIPALRLRGGYFAIATFILTLAVQALVLVAGFTHGATGMFISGITLNEVQATRLYFDLFLVLAIIATLVCWGLQRTRWHSALVAIREDEDAAEVLGVPTTRYKAIALLVGAAIAGAAGSVYATQLFYIEPTGTFDFNISLGVVVAAVLGGAGTWYGPLIGAVITQLIAQELFVHVQGVWNQLSYGVLLVVVVLVVPRGLASIRLRSRRAERKRAERQVA
jgi:branched-chain amino acid transport system permease protein